MEVFFYYLPLKMVKVQKMNVDLSHFNNNNTFILINDWLCILSFVTFIDCWFLNIQQQVQMYVRYMQNQNKLNKIDIVYTIQKVEGMEQPGQQHCNKQKVGYMIIDVYVLAFCHTYRRLEPKCDRCNNWGYIGEMFSATKSMCCKSMTACFNARYNIACLYCKMY